MPALARLATALAIAIAAICGAAVAQPALQAADANGARVDTRQLQGKVALLYYWSTGCAVCRDSLPELRANAAGWRGKPFALTTINVDKRAEDWLAYERLAAQLQRPLDNHLGLRLDAGAPVPARLPLTLVVDMKGKVVARYEGRIAPEAWDAVAELLP